MAGDPSFSLVQSLLHFDATNQATTFTGSETDPHTYSRTGAAVISTAQAKFGGSSLYLPDGNSWLSTGNSIRFNPGSNPYTLECFFYCTNSGGLPHLLSISDDSGAWEIRMFVDNGKLSAKVYYGGSYKVTLLGENNIALNTWHHGRFVYTGSAYLLFLNGQTIATTARADTMPAATPHLNIGSVRRTGYSGYQWRGWIDEVRVTIGAARSDADFTPPAAPFPDYALAYIGLGRALFSDGAIASLVRAHDASSGALVATGTPDQTSGAYSLLVTSPAPLHHSIYREGYRPLMHGPITPVEED